MSTVIVAAAGKKQIVPTEHQVRKVTRVLAAEVFDMSVAVHGALTVCATALLQRFQRRPERFLVDSSKRGLAGLGVPRMGPVAIAGKG
jgi:hypothetical protein